MRLSSLFSDGMVLQRGSRTRMNGEAVPGSIIKVEFESRVYETAAGNDGSFCITFNELKPGGPYEMILFSDETGTEESPNKLLLKDIYVGDVWLLSGQSNMQLPVARVRVRFEDEVRTAIEPAIRSFEVPLQYCFGEQIQTLHEGRWKGLSQETVNQFSAAGFFMARALYKKHGIPIGLVQTAIGGITVESYMSEESLEEAGGYEKILNQNRDKNYVKSVLEEDRKLISEWYAALDEKDEGLKEQWMKRAWTEERNTTELPAIHTEGVFQGWHGSVWVNRQFELTEKQISDGLLVLGTLVDADQTYVNGVFVGRTEYCYPPRRYPVPAAVLHTGLNTVTVRVISTGNPWGFIKDKEYSLRLKDQVIGLNGIWKYRIGATMSRRRDETFFQYKPAALYNGMIYPLRDYRIAGIAFYQGESNTGAQRPYDVLFRRLIADWRKLFHDEKLPFIYVQLPNFSGTGSEITHGSSWAVVREDQRNTLNVPNTAMAVAIDVGEFNDLHPLDKKSIGERLALCAEKLYYGDQVVNSGPVIHSAEVQNRTIHLSFDELGSGLVKKDADKPIPWFEVRTKEASWHQVLAEIEKDMVCLTELPEGKAEAVRYAWNDNPYGINLYNKEGLPAVPFYYSLTDN